MYYYLPRLKEEYGRLYFIIRNTYSGGLMCLCYNKCINNPRPTHFLKAIPSQPQVVRNMRKWVTSITCIIYCEHGMHSPIEVWFLRVLEDRNLSSLHHKKVMEEQTSCTGWRWHIQEPADQEEPSCLTCSTRRLHEENGGGRRELIFIKKVNVHGCQHSFW